MNHADHVYLLRPGIPAETGSVWADFGAGEGAFTLALAELLGDGTTIFSVDVDRRALERNARETALRFPTVRHRTVVADFTRPLDLPALDGLVMANALHFMRDKWPVVIQLKKYLKPDGRFLLVEYNVDRGNHWVPYPLSYQSWAELAIRVGFGHVEFIGRRPSRFLQEIYAAAAW